MKQQAGTSAPRKKREVRGLTRAQGRVLALIGAHGEGGVATTVSKQAMAELLSIDIKTVDRAIMRLKDEGLIEVIPRYDENGAQLANGYRLIRRE